MILVYTTYPNKKIAEVISENLLQAKLIACVNYSSIEASLVWKNEKTSESEIVALYKTTEGNWLELVKTIESLHPYDIPCIIKYDAIANEAYDDWVKESVK